MTSPRRPIAAWLRVIALSALLFISIPQAVSAAICCRCVLGGDPTVTCVKGDAKTCNDLKSQSENQILRTATCRSAPLSATDCNVQSQGGVCELGPVDGEFYGIGVADTSLPAVPTLNVKIPGLEFATDFGSDRGYATIPFLAQYISAVYKFLIVASAIAAAVMIVYGGFLYIAGGAVPSIKRGKEIITDAVIGLLLILGVYVILNTINPELLSLRPLRVQRITTIDYSLMQKQYGFKSPDGIEAREKKAAADVSGGLAPLIAAQDGENVSIDDIQTSGTGPQRLASFCTAPAEAAKAKTFAEKSQLLVRTILGWKKTCVDEKKCAYIRAGYTQIPSGEMSITALDAGYAYNMLKQYGKDPGWDTGCDLDWSSIGADYYKPVKPKSGSKEDIKAAADEYNKKFADFKDGGRCNNQIKETYKKEVADRAKKSGIFGGDCGTTLVQMYSCAGAKTARGDAYPYTSGTIIKSLKERPEGRDVIVFLAMSWKDYVDQVNAAGGLRFGDLFNVGQQNWQHNFMYTGGREDVPFDWFEMGSSGRDGIVGTPVDIGGGFIIGGMYAWPRGTPPDYFMELAKKRGHTIFPISVWRPYDYEPCTSRSQCSEGQACHCTLSDIPDLQAKINRGDSAGIANTLKNNTCSMESVCHEVRPLSCDNDEQCPKGYYCKNKEKGIGGGSACTLGEAPAPTTPSTQQ